MLALGIGCGAVPLQAQRSPLAGNARVAAAERILERLRAGEYDAQAASVDPATPPGVFSAEALRRIWEGVTVRVGPLASTYPRRSFPVAGKHAVELDATFARAPVSIRLVMDDEGRLAGIFFSDIAGPPAYADTATFSERELTVGDAAWPLPAILTLPVGAGPFPAVVLVHGSGPGDRDEAVGGVRPFRDLAWGLASRGIAVLRYDKRTYVHGARMRDVDLEQEVLADALAALDSARAAPAVDPRRVYVLGHSLGGYLAPTIARRDGRLAGAILLAVPTVPLSALNADQFHYLASLEPTVSPQLQAMVALADSLKAGTVPDRGNVFGAPLRYWREVDAVRPVEVARDMPTPLLVLQGGRDYQVPAGELEKWRQGLAGRPGVTLREFPVLNHLFVAGMGRSTPAEYALPGNVDVQVVNAIAAWIDAADRRRD